MLYYYCWKKAERGPFRRPVSVSSTVARRTTIWTRSCFSCTNQRTDPPHIGTDQPPGRPARNGAQKHERTVCQTACQQRRHRWRGPAQRADSRVCVRVFRASDQPGGIESGSSFEISSKSNFFFSSFSIVSSFLSGLHNDGIIHVHLV